MKKFLVLLFLILVLPVYAESISGGISKNIVDDRFYGNWLVRGEIIGENNPKGFRSVSSQIWNLWKDNNSIILENRLTGAKGKILVDKAFSGQSEAYLKFTNRDEKVLENNMKIILVETPEIKLKENTFQGIDTFEIKKYKNNTLYKQEMVKYKIIGKRIN